MPHQRLIVFTKYPTPGFAKTRLIPHLGAEKAAQLHRQLTAHTLQQAQHYCDQHPCDLEICYTGSDRASMQAWLGSGLTYTPQGEGDLGDRMVRALTTAFRQTVETTVLIGTDCPGMTPSLLWDAFSKLQTYDLVLGPAEDGGYYLVGLRRMEAAQYQPLFHVMPWSTDRVLSETCDRAQRLQLSTALLPTLPDIDRPADLQHLPPQLQIF
ncbi:MAG: TIGR04282 family arsenosugar biosynthesis glycosyltransferase [Synechococcales bacterium]|nr:TIGR04282 family arsenosugar biosynthesis glycosyltransferase [Synechococcales bacterium]